VAAQDEPVSVEPLSPADRGLLRPLLEPDRPGDALAVYYALYHPAARVRLWARRKPGGLVEGFSVRAQTGQDLFRPLVTLRVRKPDFAEELLRAASEPGRPASFSIPEHLSLWIFPHLTVESRRTLLLYRLNPSGFEAAINIFVRENRSPDGLPLFEIHDGDRPLAAAGINWRFPGWAEIYVVTDPAVRERKYGSSVCAALCQKLLAENRSVLYAVPDSNYASIRLAQRLGFEDTGERELFLTGFVTPGNSASADPDSSGGGRSVP
jgi:RimJ/RimL family protein N-acetyltransferase